MGRGRYCTLADGAAAVGRRLILRRIVAKGPPQGHGTRPFKLPNTVPS